MCTPPRPAGAAARERREGSPTLATIVRECGDDMRRSGSLTSAQRRVLHAIEVCRTPALGGHLERCDRCGAQRAVYHSCRNRHCPQCQTLAQARWVEARCADLLPIPYFHVVFTLPHGLNAFAQHCPRLIYTLLFRCAAETLKAFARDPRHLGGELGITAVLHTWGQNLSQHLHLHCVVTGGALAQNGARWIPARKGFLFPVRALSKVFRAKYLAALERAVARERLPADLDVGSLLRTLCGTPWVVYAKPPFGGPEQVLAYLGRYTHRIALSNDRILAVHDGVVDFRWRDYADGNRTKTMHLAAPELLRRFLLHVLPPGFPRIRHFGLLANRQRAKRLARCRALLAVASPPRPPPPREAALDTLRRLTGVDLSLCPVCHKGTLHLVAQLAPGTPSPALLDTS
jgi:hypothetical protein